MKRFFQRLGRCAYVQRLGRVAAPAFLLFFTGAFFGPLDIVNANRAYLTFTAGDLFWPLLGLTLGGTLLLAALLAPVPGKGHNAVLGLLFGLALMFYLQGVLLGKNLSALDGSDFLWQNDPAAAYKNLALWLAAVGALVFLSARFPALMRTAIPIVCMALCVAQISALAASWDPAAKEGPNYQLSGDEQFVLSEEENIVVITLDQVSPNLFEDVLALDPALEEVFRDFVYYDNTAASYSLTFPSLTAVLTGEKYDGSIGVEDYFHKAWHSDTAEYFYEKLHENGYIANLYVESNYAALTAENMLGKAENVVDAGDLVVRWPLVQNAVWMSLYRYCPVILKNPFCVSTGKIVDVAEYRGTEKLCINEDFYPRLLEEGLSTAPGPKRFVWYHTKGAHFPYTVGYDGLPLGFEAESAGEYRLDQLHGYMVAVADFLQQMKDLGLYDDATIILSADHGYFRDLQILFLIKTPGQHFEQMQVSSAPIAQEDTLATVLAVLGEDYSPLGRSVFDTAENEVRTRRTYVWGYHPDYPEVPWIGNINQWDNEANGKQHYNVMAAFDYDGDRSDLAEQYGRWYYQKTADTIVPLTDSFY